MISISEVETFLNQFQTKMKIFGIIYRDDRGKNQKALEELPYGIILKNLEGTTPEYQQKVKKVNEAKEKYEKALDAYEAKNGKSFNNNSNNIERKFEKYMEEYDWAFDTIMEFYENNQLGYEFSDVGLTDEDVIEEVMEEAFVAYPDDGREFDTSMYAYEVLDYFYDYLDQALAKRGYR